MLSWIEGKILKPSTTSIWGGGEFRKRWEFGRFSIKFSWRDSEGMGRFGGGWNWSIGFRLSKSTILFSLLFCELTFTLSKPKKESEDV